MSKKSAMPAEPGNHFAVFQERTIRRAWHNEEWWFAVVDVVAVLTGSTDVKQYIKKMRSRDPQLDANWGTTCTPLPLLAPDGKLRATNCANTEGLFRIIQSIPSPQAEPFKRWLAQVGYERVKEIENPELASARARELVLLYWQIGRDILVRQAKQAFLGAGRQTYRLRQAGKVRWRLRTHHLACDKVTQVLREFYYDHQCQTYRYCVNQKEKSNEQHH